MKKINITLLTLLLVSTSLFAQGNMNEAYTKFLSSFADSTCYAVVNLDGQDVLFVSQETYNNEDRNNKPIRTALAAQLYGLDSKGKILCLGELRSQGTLYPLSLSKDGIMTAGHTYVNKYCISNGTLSIVEDVNIAYLKNNGVKCYYENRLKDVYRDSSNDKDFTEMISTFEAATPISFCYAQTSSKCVKPLPASVNITAIKDATVPAEFTADDFNWMGSNLSMTVYEEDIYDAVEVCSMAKGDTLIWNGDTIIVNEVEQRGGTKVINKGIEEGGAELVSYGGGTFRGTLFDDHSTYTKLGKVTLPLSDNFTIIDCGEEPSTPSKTISTGQKKYLQSLKNHRRTFTSLNTRVLVENGVITNITRHWIP